jgi:hypothetical protein
MVHYLIFAKPDMKSINEIYGKNYENEIAQIKLFRRTLDNSLRLARIINERCNNMRRRGLLPPPLAKEREYVLIKILKF